MESLKFTELKGVLNIPDRKDNIDYFIFNKDKISNTNLSKELHDNVGNMVTINIITRDRTLYCNVGLLYIDKQDHIYKFKINNDNLDDILWDNVGGEEIKIFINLLVDNSANI